MASERIGLVLAGGGARGAYEAGVLAVLLPELERQGRRPSVLVGASVGALNAAFLAAHADVPAAEATEALLERWHSISRGKVIRPIVGPATVAAAASFAGDALGVPGMRLTALLDPAPMRRTLREWLDVERLHRNVAAGLVDAVGVVATHVRTQRSVVFVSGPERERIERTRGVSYVPVRIGHEHLEASAAIPVVFPPVRVDEPDEARGWYVDGGTRLNTPLVPALDLGVDRVVVGATHALEPVPLEPDPPDAPQPDVAEGAHELLHATLVDPLTEDLRMLGKINLMAARGGGQAAQRWRVERGKEPYRRVPYLVVAPGEQGALGRLATEAIEARAGGLRGLTDPDLALVRRLLGGPGRGQGELLSYLAFDAEFVHAAAERGRRDAEELLAAGDPWRVEPPGEASRRTAASRSGRLP